MPFDGQVMTLDRLASTTSVIDVLDHVLDKGIVIDAWVRVSLAGIDLVTVEARIVVASIGTYLTYKNSLLQVDAGSLVAPEVVWTDRTSLGAQLRRIRERLDRHQVEPQTLRRAEDRLREELHDARAKTIRRH